MTIELKLPELGENIDSGQVVRVLVQVGERLAREQPIIEIETGKATVEVPATSPGKVAEVLVKEGDTIRVGQPVLLLEEEEGPSLSATAVEAAEAPEPPPPPPPSVAQPTPPPAEAPPQAPPLARAVAGTVMAAPHVRRFAREIGVDINDVVGSGPSGRVSEEDVKRHAREARAAGPSLDMARPGALRLPDQSAFGPVDREPMSTVRQRIAEHMALCWNTIPHVVLQARADISELEAFRRKYKERAEAAGGKLTLTAILVKVVAAGLRAFPRVNASLDAEARELVLKRYVHVGVATDTPRGLLVPVIRDADRKSLIEIGVELTELSQKARAGKLMPSEMQGAGFSVSNLGGLGVEHFSAIVNHPETAILAVGRASMEPVWDGAAFQPRLMLPLALNIDHRVLDGADGARFLSFVVQAIEQPLLIALGG